MPDLISVGNCPDCEHFPTQFVKDPGGREYVRHLANAKRCRAYSEADRVQELEEVLREIRDTWRRYVDISKVRSSEPLDCYLLTAEAVNRIEDLVRFIEENEEPKP